MNYIRKVYKFLSLYNIMAREISINIDWEEGLRRISKVRDPYGTAAKLLKKGQIKKLVNEHARVIGCVPIAILNSGLSLDYLASQAVKDEVPNQFCYLLLETEDVARRFGRRFDPSSAINYLEKNLQKEIKPLGSFPPEAPISDMQMRTRVRCGRFGFYRHYEVYFDHGQVA